MLLLEDLDLIALKKIGLRNFSNHVDFGKGTGRPRRILSDTALKHRKMIKLIDALELRIARRDGGAELSEIVKFAWEVVSFDFDCLVLQLYIDNPETVSEGG